MRYQPSGLQTATLLLQPVRVWQGVTLPFCAADKARYEQEVKKWNEQHTEAQLVLNKAGYAKVTTTEQLKIAEDRHKEKAAKRTARALKRIAQAANKAECVAGNRLT
jgi:hypothetical protein